MQQTCTPYIAVCARGTLYCTVRSTSYLKVAVAWCGGSVHEREKRKKTIIPCFPRVIIPAQAMFFDHARAMGENLLPMPTALLFTHTCIPRRGRTRFEWRGSKCDRYTKRVRKEADDCYSSWLPYRSYLTLGTLP